MLAGNFFASFDSVTGGVLALADEPIRDRAPLPARAQAPLGLGELGKLRVRKLEGPQGLAPRDPDVDELELGTGFEGIPANVGGAGCGRVCGSFGPGRFGELIRHEEVDPGIERIAFCHDITSGPERNWLSSAFLVVVKMGLNCDRIN
jgi:hypothetical protein